MNEFAFADHYCAVCGEYPAEAHHWLHSRGAGGGDDPENIIYLCHRHHMEFHSLGGHTWFAKYRHRLTKEQRRLWLQERGK